MKFNLKNRPKLADIKLSMTKHKILLSKSVKIAEMEEWFEGFEKKLRELWKDAKENKLPSMYNRGVQRLAEEILGE